MQNFSKIQVENVIRLQLNLSVNRFDFISGLFWQTNNKLSTILLFSAGIHTITWAVLFYVVTVISSAGKLQLEGKRE